MSVNDRVALELGRALIRAHAAEAALADEQGKTEALLARVAEAERGEKKPAARTTRGAK